MPQIPPMLQLNSPKSPELDQLVQILFKQGYLLDRTVLPRTTGLASKFGVKIEDAVIYFQQTHLGPDGKQLVDTGVVDEATWWALKNPAGAKQRSGLVPSVPSGIYNSRRQLLECAIAEHAKGVQERPNGSNRSRDIDQYFPDWLRKSLVPGEKGPAWCCFFVNAMVTKAFDGKRPWGSYLGSCAALWEAVSGKTYPKLKELPIPVAYESSGNENKITPGDVFVMLHPKQPGKPQTGHTGLVLRVSKNGSVFNTVEGNCGNRVKVGVRESSSIHGFIYPHGNDGSIQGFSRQLLATASTGTDDTR